jgi:hypothetical protein
VANPRTIDDLQNEIARALENLQGHPELTQEFPLLLNLAPPKGTIPEVTLRNRRSRRKIKKTAAAENWDPRSGEISIVFAEVEPVPEGLPDHTEARQYSEMRSQKRAADDPLRDVVRALDRAEKERALKFVSLIWFRDKYLPRQGLDWATSGEARQEAIAKAIERNIILTGKVPNPKNPSFPTTSIRLNRPREDVQRILAGEQEASRGFEPIEILGESLSQTVAADRR